MALITTMVLCFRSQNFSYVNFGDTNHYKYNSFHAKKALPSAVLGYMKVVVSCLLNTRHVMPYLQPFYRCIFRMLSWNTSLWEYRKYPPSQRNSISTQPKCLRHYDDDGDYWCWFAHKAYYSHCRRNHKYTTYPLIAVLCLRQRSQYPNTTVK